MPWLHFLCFGLSPSSELTQVSGLPHTLQLSHNPLRYRLQQGAGPGPHLRRILALSFVSLCRLWPHSPQSSIVFLSLWVSQLDQKFLPSFRVLYRKPTVKLMAVPTINTCWHVTYISSLKLHNNSMRFSYLLSLFHRPYNSGSMKRSDLPQVAQLASGGGYTWTLVVPLWVMHSSLPYFLSWASGNMCPLQHPPRGTYGSPNNP